MKVVHTVQDLRAELEGKANVGFVPTMGALHEGHMSLIELAQKEAEFVVVSIFVNPTQFGDSTDFAKYPKDLDQDIQRLESLDKAPDILFAPSVQEVYPEGLPERLEPRAGALGSVFEGVSRPGHFEGMLHVVSWFFRAVEPQVAVFGAKDAQQLFLVKRMVHREFKDQIRIVEGETVRAESMLALSSRNARLSPEGLAAAPVLFEAMSSASELIGEGVAPGIALEQAKKQIESQPLAKLDYLALVSKESFAPIADDFTGIALMLVAAVVDGVRLIDNISFYIQEQE
ncbi:MAG: pantoate--beta-alanine ligase [Micrococcales bacterium]|nr:pantoate--beta-alanine ligase [Microbacteriaceae bacterium]NBR22577.1 pantoate--beta-alanine ligase [Micrococcales bacterium]NBS60839.1 pantoate--beta-alanine ligase [Microbacteriaceae bacterium]